MKFERSAKGTPQKVESDLDECMTKLCSDLDTGLSKGNSYYKRDVWCKYQMCAEKDLPIRKKSYQSRITTFYARIYQNIRNRF